MAQAIPLEVLQAYWTDTAIPLRERVFAAMAYDTAARAGELLGLNVEDLDLANKQAGSSARAAAQIGSSGPRSPPGYCPASSAGAAPGRCSSPTSPPHRPDRRRG